MSTGAAATSGDKRVPIGGRRGGISLQHAARHPTFKDVWANDMGVGNGLRPQKFHLLDAQGGPHQRRNLVLDCPALVRWNGVCGRDGRRGCAAEYEFATGDCVNGIRFGALGKKAARVDGQR